MSGYDLRCIDGTDIDFSVELITGIDEKKQAALSRILNAVSYDDAAYGVDLFQELGALGDSGYAQSLGLRCSAAIMNDTRFASAQATKATQSTTQGVSSVSLSFLIETEDGETFSLSTLISNGTVRLLENA